MRVSATPSTTESLILTLFDLVNHLTKNGEWIVRPEGLTLQQWLLMLQVAGDPNFPAAEADNGQPVLASAIASARGVSRSNISALVTSLIHKGLLAQQEAPHDRRQKTLRVTEAGLAALDRIEPRRRQANDFLFSDFDKAELAAALETLNRCLAVLRSAHPATAAARPEAATRTAEASNA